MGVKFRARYSTCWCGQNSSLMRVCCGLTWQTATRTMELLACSSPCSGMGRRLDKKWIHGLKSKQFNKTTKEIIIIEYAKQAILNTIFSRHWILHSQFPSSKGGNHQTHEEVQTPEKVRIPATWPTPIYILSMTSVVWYISIGQFGLAAWLWSLPALVHLLNKWTWETEIHPWFLSNNENQQCVINSLLILNSEHSSY